MRDLTKIVLYSLCAAIAVVSKEILAFLPNVELVSFLLILYALHFDWKGSLLIAVIFSFLQILLYGVGIWTPMYFIVWSALVLVVYKLRFFLVNESRCALFSGLFGLVFGFLFSLPYFAISLRFGWLYFLKGIPFDLVHALSNYIIMALLFEKANRIFGELKKRYAL